MLWEVIMFDKLRSVVKLQGQEENITIQRDHAFNIKMKKINFLVFLFIFCLTLIVVLDIKVFAESKDWTVTKYWEKFKNGPPADPNFFPLIVWLQDPKMASKYKAIGINTYMGLWKGPKPGDIEALKSAGMFVICNQNEVGLKHKDDKTIIAWMHDDEPDNAQPIPGRKGEYGPCVKPSKLIDDYNRMKREDPTRPIIVNFGQGVANDEWKGRGSGASLNDYREYCKGADIVSFDVYPVVGIRKNDGENYLWWQAKGLDRLRDWAGEDKPRFNCIECTHIGSNKKPKPEHVRAEVWMSIIHGSRGIIYFCHEWYPKFNEHALLDDSEMASTVAKINSQITSLASVINGPDLKGVVNVSSLKPDIPIDIMVKKTKEEIYIFAVTMRNGTTKAKFQINDMKSDRKVQVVGEDRTIDMKSGEFEDEFKIWEVHIYKIAVN